MHASLSFPLALPLSFARVLVRLAGAFVFVPMPGREAGPGMARIVFAFAAAIALYPRWPQLRRGSGGIYRFPEGTPSLPLMYSLVARAA